MAGPPPTFVDDFVEIEADRLSDISGAMGPDGDRAAARFARGCRCFAIQTEAEIVAYGWLSVGREWIGELGVWITPAAGEGYIWNCFTLESHRRRGNYRRLLEGFVRLPGLSRLWIGSIEDPAQKADADAGFAPVLLFEVWRVFGMRLLRARPAPTAEPQVLVAAHARLGPWRPLARAASRVH